MIIMSPMRERLEKGLEKKERELMKGIVTQSLWTALVVTVCIVSAFALSLGVADAESGSGATITVVAKIERQLAQAEVKVMSTASEPREVAKGLSGQPLSVSDGSYDLYITCMDLLDQPTITIRDVIVQPGATVEREANFPSGTVTLHVKVGGRTLKKKTLVLFKDGEAVPGKAKTGLPFKLTPGPYEAEVSVGRKAKSRITGIQVYEGAKRNIPVSL